MIKKVSRPSLLDEWRETADRVRRLAQGLAQGPERSRLEHYADDLLQRADRLEAALAASSPTKSSPPLMGRHPKTGNRLRGMAKDFI
jgi:hypothetical protein